MNVVVDTCIWVDYFAGRDAALSDAVDRLLEHGLVLMTPVIAAELVSGARKNDQNVRLKAFLGDLELADFSLAHWFRVGELRARLQSEGIILSQHLMRISPRQPSTKKPGYSHMTKFSQNSQKRQVFGFSVWMSKKSPA